MAPERKAEQLISPEDLKFLLLNEAKQIGDLLNENPGKETVSISKMHSSETFELPRIALERQRYILWTRLQEECLFTKEQAFKAVGMEQPSEQPSSPLNPQV